MGSVLKEGLTRVAEALATPLVPADYLDLFDPLRKGADLRGRIEEVTMETADAATFVIRAGADWAGHVPGQYVRIGVDVDGVRNWRPYSLTHGPRDDNRISVTVKAVPDGLVSSFLVRECKPGTLVHLEQAAGDFVSSQNVVEEIIPLFDDSELSAFLAGQNSYAGFAAAAPTVNAKLMQGSDDAIQRALADPVNQYLNGELTIDQLWSTWKDSVRNEFPDLIVP